MAELWKKAYMSKFMQDNLRNSMIINLKQNRFLQQILKIKLTNWDWLGIFQAPPPKKISAISCHELVFQISVSYLASFVYVLILRDPLFSFLLWVQAPSSGVSLSGDQDLTLRERLGGGYPCKPKSLNFYLLLDITPTKKIESLCPSPHHRPHIGEKVFLTAFRLILPKPFSVAHIFSHTIMTYLLDQNPIIQNSVLQNYLPELYRFVF